MELLLNSPTISNQFYVPVTSTFEEYPPAPRAPHPRSSKPQNPRRQIRRVPEPYSLRALDPQNQSGHFEQLFFPPTGATTIVDLYFAAL